MAKKNQTTQANDSSNSIVELSDEDLQQVVGGNHNDVEVGGGEFAGINITFIPNGNQPFIDAFVGPIVISG